MHPIEKKNHLGAMLGKARERKTGRTGFPVRKASCIVILPRLRHRDGFGCDFFAPHVGRHSVKDFFSDFGKFTERI